MRFSAVRPISVELLDHMGSDIDVVNAARVSFSKEISSIEDKDAKLIEYLAKHKHWSPFAHNAIKIRVTAPIFLARQLVKHQVGLVWNEVSRRYVDSSPTFYIPNQFHSRPDNMKQGSGKELDTSTNVNALSYFYSVTDGCLETYKAMLDIGVAPEEARMVLPLNTNTTWIWTGNLMSFRRVYDLRIDSHAQLAAQEFATKLGSIIEPLFPISWKALGNNK